MGNVRQTMLWAHRIVGKLFEKGLYNRRQAVYFEIPLCNTMNLANTTSCHLQGSLCKYNKSPSAKVATRCRHKSRHCIVTIAVNILFIAAHIYLVGHLNLVHFKLICQPISLRQRRSKIKEKKKRNEPDKAVRKTLRINHANRASLVCNRLLRRFPDQKKKPTISTASKIYSRV